MSLAARTASSADLRTGPVVVHLDHTSEAGGAELALLRVLEKSNSWTPILRIPRRAAGQRGVFRTLDDRPGVVVSEAGKPQKPGASSGGGIVRMAKFAFDALSESANLRFSRDFRRADVIHSNTSRSAVYGAVACTLSRKKFVVHLRDMTSRDSLGPVGFALFTKVALRRADGVIANSRATLASAAPYLRCGTSQHVIASPIGLESRDPAPEVRPTVSRIGMIARIDPWKGHSLLLRAFAATCAGTTVRLVLAGAPAFGKDQDLEELRQLSETLGIPDQVDFLGHVDDVSTVIASLDVCVQASVRPEPLGQNVLQYLVAGKPVIAVNAGGPAEWIRSGENGILTELDDVDSLTAALRLLINDPALRAHLANNAATTPGIATDIEVAELHADAFRSILVGQEKVGTDA